MAKRNIPVGLFYASYNSDCNYELNSRVILTVSTVDKLLPDNFLPNEPNLHRLPHLQFVVFLLILAFVYSPLSQRL